MERITRITVKENSRSAIHHREKPTQAGAGWKASGDLFSEAEMTRVLNASKSLRVRGLLDSS